jgi:hypothetical protein
MPELKAFVADFKEGDSSGMKGVPFVVLFVTGLDFMIKRIL